MNELHPFYVDPITGAVTLRQAPVIRVYVDRPEGRTELPLDVETRTTLELEAAMVCFYDDSRETLGDREAVRCALLSILGSLTPEQETALEKIR